jgi:hypothetical protein
MPHFQDLVAFFHFCGNNESFTPDGHPGVLDFHPVTRRKLDVLFFHPRYLTLTTRAEKKIGGQFEHYF